MPIDSFGYQVMSLAELIASLTDLADKVPDVLNEPVWIDYCGAGILMPIKAAQVRYNFKDGPRTYVIGEAG